MEQAAQAISDAGDDADLDALEVRFTEAETAHTSAVEVYNREKRIVKAREALPTAPVEDDPEGEPRQRSNARVSSEPRTYERGGPHSIFRDIYKSQTSGDREAFARLDRHRDEMAVERRDLSSTDAAGGYLVAPLYLQDEFVSYARAGRVWVDALNPVDLPEGTDSINIPRMSSGASVADQSADNVALANVDPVFDTIAGDVKTAGGYVDVAQQLVDRSAPGVDEVVFADLAAAYAVNLDVKVLNSSVVNNKGTLQVSGVNAVTYTDASPTLGELYPKIADAIQRIHTGIFMPADGILMAPRRWAFCLASQDSQNRPLVVPSAVAANPAAVQDGVVSQGPVGTIQGLPVFTDPNIPLTLGGGTEDAIIVARRADLKVWEDPAGPYIDTFRDVKSAQLGVRFRLFNYYAQIQSRRPSAISVISGTGLVTPTF